MYRISKNAPLPNPLLQQRALEERELLQKALEKRGFWLLTYKAIQAFEDKQLIYPSQQRGAAIVMALFVVALVAVLAASMMERLQTDIRRTELMLKSNQAYFYAQGSVNWAIDQLSNNWKEQKPNQIIDKTPIQSPVNQEQGFTISSVIYDAQGYFNLNNLVDTLYQANFMRLLTVLDPNIDPPRAQVIMQGIINWISPTAANPALDDYYLKQSLPYQAPHRLMASASELRLVQGITADLFNKLEPYIIALPQTTLININNAEAPVLMSLSPTLSLESAKAVVMSRQKEPFATIQKFLDFDVIKNNPIEGNKITVTSNYFLLETNVTVEEQHWVIYTLLQRSVKDSKPYVIVLWQSKGTL